ncbi:efflux RND transporter permease subunit [Zavarzinia compransoris]|uniref:Acriflavine resistance protein B n=1 Tax=Zavarzinia compransoris TaxID=1264899 RepID=A0A317E1V4_9PROT|nr:efflux RND transporter permease subunit [Zavarzinia compransoris]PWR20621.1 acriflavine resistance protein B [Zavarzinia compransoris]TDP44563.1 HAE1 family hydrophobic/amphiphilic exporter-1 [Zavarzinia compransoris]
MNGLSSWSIRNPVPVLVLFMVLTVAGLIGFIALRVNNTPDVDIPVVTITVAQPGAAPSELETQVTRLVEDAVAGLGSVKHITSTVSDGISVTSIQFQLGVDIDRMTNDVRNAVAAVRGDLPGDAEEPVVSRVDASGVLFIYAVRAPDMTPAERSWFIDNDVAKRLLAVKGVASVLREGGVDREIRVELNPERMAALGVSAQAVSSALRRANTNLPGGRVAIGTGEQTIRTVGSATSVEALAATRIDLPDGRAIRLSDIGTVGDAFAEPRARARFNGEEVVGFSVARSQGTSEVHVAQAVRQAIAAFDAERDDVQFEEVTSAVDFVMESYYASVEALILGAALAVVVVFWFLRDGRATFIASIAMPLSLIPTFAVMLALDQSINIVSLLALSLTVGILVDDAIVEIENIVRHISTGKKPYRAALEAADEIGLAVVATTATIIAVFMPVGFMPGIVGQFFQSFAIAACVSVAFSLVVARMLTPLMGAYMLRGEESHPHREPRWMPGYLRFLGWCLDRRFLVLIAGIGIFVGSLGLTTLLPNDFVPVSDRGRSVMSVELPPGASLAETDAAAQALTAKLKDRPEVKSIYVSTGTNTATGSPGAVGSILGEVRRATITVNLVPRGDRALNQQDFESEVGALLRQVPGTRVRFGADGSSGAKLQLALVSDDPAILAATARQVEREMRTLEGIANVASTANLARPEIRIVPKPDKAAALGVTAETLAAVVRVATLGDIDQILPKFNLADRQIPIRLIFPESARKDAETLAALRVPTSDGGSVPLAAVADIEHRTGLAQIYRLDRRSSVAIEAELIGIPLGVAAARVHALPAMSHLPPEVIELPTGDVENLAELMTGFLIALGTGVFLMYVVLVLLFKGFAHPATILTALPLSIGGAFGLLFIANEALSMPALIGILMLMGIAAKNSILLVEYVLYQRAAGMSRRDALIEAAHKRARPIIMTTVAMGAGMLPIAVGIGADTEFRAPMAIAVIGGLITSTLLSLVYVPVVFTVVDDVQAAFARRFAKRLAARRLEAEDAVTPPA